MSRVTIKDVAEKAGVSISTVSNALNGVDVLKEETRQHILRVAEEMNYVPNVHGQSLKRKKTNRITFLTSSVIGPYFYHLVESMALACEANSYTLNIVVTEDIKEINRVLSGSESDGLIIFQEKQISEKQLEIIKAHKTKTLFIDRNISDKHISSVIFDSADVAYKLTKYLLKEKCRSFLFIEGVEEMYDSIERKKGFFRAIQEFKEESIRYEVVVGAFKEEIAYDSVTKFLNDNDSPDAIVASNDLSAIGAIKACINAGYSVPEDLKVVGFDDIDIAAYISPSLTTVRNPIRQMGNFAVGSLLKMISDEMDGKSVILDGEIIKRESA